MSAAKPTETLPLGWVAPGRQVSEIRLKVYGARVERTETVAQKAVHMVFHGIRYDPDATPCKCRACAGQDRDVKRNGRIAVGVGDLRVLVLRRSSDDG